jgi:hypothetical protein
MVFLIGKNKVDEPSNSVRNDLGTGEATPGLWFVDQLGVNFVVGCRVPETYMSTQQGF